MCWVTRDANLIHFAITWTKIIWSSEIWESMIQMMHMKLRHLFYMQLCTCSACCTSEKRKSSGIFDILHLHTYCLISDIWDGMWANAWWRHQMETFSALLALCAGKSQVTGEFPAQRPVTQRFDISLICTLNKWLSKQSCGWWFEKPSRSSWRHCNAYDKYYFALSS